MDLGAFWAQIGLRLGKMVPNWGIGSHFWSLQAALWEDLGAPGCPLGVTWCQFGRLGHLKLMLEATRLI